MPKRLTKVGEHERPDHFYLPDTAKCFFWGEYTPYEHTDGKKWNFSPTNKLVSNFKKKMDRKGQLDWAYKAQATKEIAQQFATLWKWESLHASHRPALIPLPPSRSRDDAMFDPRMHDVLLQIASRTKIDLDIRDCLTFSGLYGASHETDDRPSPDQLFAELTFDSASGTARPAPGIIFLFDDVLTTGAHFVAVSRMLAQQFPGVPIVGNFVARRIVPIPFSDLSDFDDL